MNTMKRLYKDRILYHASSSSTNVFRDLEKGECDLGLMIERRFNTMWSSGEYKLDAACGFEIGEAVMPIGCSQPVRQEYSAAISFWARKSQTRTTSWDLSSRTRTCHRRRAPWRRLST